MTEDLRPRGRGPRWTPEEVEKLRALYPLHGAVGLVPEFPGRTRQSLSTKAREMELTFDARFWSREQLQVLAQCKSLEECHAAFPDHTYHSLRHRWSRLRSKPDKVAKPPKPVRIKAEKPVELPKRRPELDDANALYFDHQRRAVGTWEMDQQRARQLPKAHPFEALA